MSACPDDWTEAGDYRVGEAYACDVSKTFVRVVYAIPLAIFPLAIFYCARAMMRMIEVKGVKHFILHQSRLKTIHLSTMFAACFQILAHLAKVAEPERAIGVDQIVTWLTFIAMCLFYLGLNSSFILFVNISIKQEKFGGRKSIVRLLLFARFVIPLASLATCAAYVLVVAAVYIRPHSILMAEDLIQAFWCLLAASTMFLLFTVPFVLNSVCRDLALMLKRNPDRENDKTKDFQELLTKFREVRSQSVARNALDSTIYLVLGISATVRYWSPYIVGVQALLLSLVILGLSTLNSHRRSESSSQKNSIMSSKVSKSTTRRVASKLSMGNGSKEDTKSSKVEDVVAFSTSEPNSPNGATEEKHKSLRAFMFG